jgi:hypothetical protein
VNNCIDVLLYGAPQHILCRCPWLYNVPLCLRTLLLVSWSDSF